MTRDEILDEYEALWRQAMVEGRAQFYGHECQGRDGVVRGAGSMTCAVLIAPQRLMSALAGLVVPPWRCPQSGCDFRGGRSGVDPAMHLNNAHHWTWDMFANKFRDALAAGEARG